MRYVWPIGCALRAAGSTSKYGRACRTWHLFAAVMPEARRAIERIGAFVTKAIRPMRPWPDPH